MDFTLGLWKTQIKTKKNQNPHISGQTQVDKEQMESGTIVECVFNCITSLSREFTYSEPYLPNSAFGSV